MSLTNLARTTLLPHSLS